MQISPVIQLFLELAAIITAAQFGGMLARRLGQPRVFGELLAGVLLGPSLLNFTHTAAFTSPNLEETINDLAEMGVLMLMFSVGLDVHFSELMAVRRVALLGGILGGIAPILLAAPLMLLLGYAGETALLTGVILAASSVSISAQTLMDLGVLRTEEGFGLLATALVDDVLAILMLSFVSASLFVAESAVPQAGGARILLQAGGYIVVALLVAWFVLPWGINWLYNRHQVPYTIVAFSVVVALLFGASAQVIGGIAPITGAFIAGLGFSRARDNARRLIQESVRSIAYGLLVPIFFVHIGLMADLRQISLAQLPLAALLLGIAVVSKIGGSGLGAYLGGFDRGTAFRLGVCMISRGEVSLIVMTLGLSAGILDQPTFALLFLVVLATLILTPVLIRQVFEGFVLVRE